MAALSVASHVSALSAGISLSSQAFSTPVLIATRSLLPLRLLRHNLFNNLSHLHMEPPLFNLFTGEMLRLSPGTAVDLLQFLGVALSVFLSIATFFLMRELLIPRWLCVPVIAVFVIGDPAQILFPSRYSIALPSATILVSMAWSASRWIRTGRLSGGVLYSLLSTVLILLNSAFQIYLIIVLVVPLVWSMRHRWQQTTLALLAPLVLGGAWYVNELFQFNNFTTTSAWGMQLASTTVGGDAHSDLVALVAMKDLNSSALIPPYSCLAAYKKIARDPLHQVVALSLKEKFPCPKGANGFNANSENYNNIAYVSISQGYLRNDLQWVLHRPLTFVHQLVQSARSWMIPANEENGGTSTGLGSYEQWYDHYVSWQPDPPNRSSGWSLVATSTSSLAWGTVVISICDLIILPLVLLWRRQQLTKTQRALGWWMWMVIGALFLYATLFAAGQGALFRFEAGSLPIVAATAALYWIFLRPEKLEVPEEVEAKRIIV